MATIIKPNKNLSSEELIGQIAKEITLEEPIKITGLGIFKLKMTAPRNGRNPATGEELRVPAKLKLSFKASKPFMESLAEKIK